jgi:hypothetical protein
MTNDKIGFITRFFLKMVVYYLLTKLHFRLFFKRNLVDECLANSRDYYLAEDRHVNMTMSVVYSNIARKNIIAGLVRQSFFKTMLDEAAFERRF